MATTPNRNTAPPNTTDPNRAKRIDNLAYKERIVRGLGKGCLALSLLNIGAVGYGEYHNNKAETLAAVYDSSGNQEKEDQWTDGADEAAGLRNTAALAAVASIAIGAGAGIFQRRLVKQLDQETKAQKAEQGQAAAEGQQLMRRFQEERAAVAQVEDPQERVGYQEALSRLHEDRMDDHRERHHQPEPSWKRYVMPELDPDKEY